MIHIPENKLHLLDIELFVPLTEYLTKMLSDDSIRKVYDIFELFTEAYNQPIRDSSDKLVAYLKMLLLAYQKDNVTQSKFSQDDMSSGDICKRRYTTDPFGNIRFYMSKGHREMLIGAANLVLEVKSQEKVYPIAFNISTGKKFPDKENTKSLLGELYKTNIWTCVVRPADDRIGLHLADETSRSILVPSNNILINSQSAKVEETEAGQYTTTTIEA